MLIRGCVRGLCSGRESTDHKNGLLILNTGVRSCGFIRGWFYQRLFFLLVVSEGVST